MTMDADGKSKRMLRSTMREDSIPLFVPISALNR
jgi:hypothetical protein